MRAVLSEAMSRAYSEAASDSSAEEFDVTVRVGDRFYPQNLDRRFNQPVRKGKKKRAPRGDSRHQQPGRPKLPVKELKSGPSHGAVRAQLNAELVQRLPFLTEPQRGRTMDLAKSFYESHSRLVGFRADLEALVPYLCRANLEFRQNSGETKEAERRAMLERKLTSMIEKTRFDIRPISNPVNAQLLALSPEKALAKMRESLRSSVDRFVNDFFDSLDKLVDREICGLVEWTSKNTCCYHFFREVIVQDREELATEITHGRTFRSVEEVDRGTHTHRIARHEYHTGDAVQTTIADTQVVLPVAVRELLDRIPDWLESVIRIIDGTLVRALIVERDVETENWENRRMIDRVYFQYEPGVVIDHVVLTGWGPLDIDAELARRELEDNRAQRIDDTKQSAIWAAASGILSLLSLALHWTGGGMLSLAVAYLMIVCAVASSLAALYAHAASRNKRFLTGQPFVAGLSQFLVLTGVGLGLTFGGGLLSLPLAAAAIGGLLLAFPIFRSDVA